MFRCEDCGKFHADSECPIDLMHEIADIREELEWGEIPLDNYIKRPDSLADLGIFPRGRTCNINDRKMSAEARARFQGHEEE